MREIKIASSRSRFSVKFVKHYCAYMTSVSTVLDETTQVKVYDAF